MKSSFSKFIILFSAFAGLLGAGNVGFAQVTLGVSPSTISNTYAGVITLNLSGLTNGEKVTIQRYLDLNANGTIDAGEPMVDAFNITDGGAMVIGGVTNLSVPFDSNPAGGAITTSLIFAAPYTLENTVGHNIYRVVSPTGRFSPMTATFNVTNAATGQSVSGIVYSNGVAPVPYAVVVALQQPNTSFAGAVVADAAGHYSLNLNPGTYSLLSAPPNYFADQGGAPQVTLTNGANLTNDLFLTNGTVTISGSVYDSVSSNGVGGVMLQLQSGNLLSIAFSDANGNYTAAVSPNFWKIQPIKERMGRRAYVVSQNKLQVDTTTNSVTNANIAVYKGNALFYGRITDNANVPFANVQLDSSDGMNNQFNSKGYSNPNGYYAVAALGTNNDWNCNANSGNNVALNNYVLNNSNNTNILAGQAVQANFVALPITAHITGQVRDNLGNPVAGVGLFAGTVNSGNFYQSLNVSTDNSGNYSVGVASGTWGVEFDNGGGDQSLDQRGLADYFGPHNVTVPPTNDVLNITVYQSGTPVITQPQRMSSTQFGFNINGPVGVNYTVQVSTNAASTNWANLFSLQLTNSPFFVTDSQATNSPRFYRVRKN